MANKTLIIGIDGTVWELLDKLITFWKHPTFKYLKEILNYKTLESTVPPLTGPAGITFFSLGEEGM